MFFNEDILFRNGSLALVWMAGNEEFKNKKGRRHKHYVALLKANVRDICNDLRNLFPQMGTAHGINLKKMGTLAKGVGIIYRIKIEEFARNVIQASILLKRPVTVQINLRGERLALKAKSKALDAPDIINDEDPLVNEDYQIAALDYDTFGENYFLEARMVDHGDSPRTSAEFVGVRVAISPPHDRENENQERQRSARKRRKGVVSESDTGGETDLVNRLYNLVGLDPRAHTLHEEESGFGKNDREIIDIGGDMDFGNGLDFLRENGEGDGGDVPMDIDRNGEDVCPPAADGDEPMTMMGPPAADREEPTTMMGPPSNLEYDSQLRVLETPSALTTRPENMRQRRNVDNRDPDETVMDLPEIDSPGVRRGKRARRRLPLQIDVETTITSRDMLARVNAMRDEINADMLDQLMVNSRAPPKSSWKLEAHGRTTAIDIITTSGRSCSSIALNAMIAKIMKGSKEVPGVKEQPRDRTEQPTDAAMSMVNATDVRRDDQSSLAGFSVTAGANATDFRRDDQSSLAGVSVVTGLVPEPSVVGVMDDFPPIPDEQEDYRPFDDGVGVEQQCPTDLERGDQLGNVFQVPEGNRRSTVDEQRLAKSIDVDKSFDQMYPPNKTKKRRAARAFFQLLKMQARKEFALDQEQSFGPLYVAKVP